MTKYKNIPFFIPHLGCSHNCVFCAQDKITGKTRDAKSLADELASLRQTIQRALPTIKEGSVIKLGFFGGSFTGIERERMLALLQTGHEYVKTGRITGIRVSTRPDFIDTETLDILKRYGVLDIELGIQSTDDHVLRASGRGHTAQESYDSARLIINHGFSFIGQMMVGLPESTIRSEIQTAKAIVEMGAKEARIYPIVVFDKTPLMAMLEDERYLLPSGEDLIYRSALCLDVFDNAGVRVIKIGLHASEGLAAAKGGANHPATGELVKARLYEIRISRLLEPLKEAARSKNVVISIKESDISKLTGHGGKALKRLKDKFLLNNIKVLEDDLPEFSPNIKILD